MNDKTFQKLVDKIVQSNLTLKQKLELAEHIFLAGVMEQDNHDQYILYTGVYSDDLEEP